MNYRYTLKSGSKKARCPACGRLTFKQYIDTRTDEPLEPQFGRCDREAKCGYFLKPDWQGRSDTQQQYMPQEVRPRVFIPTELVVRLQTSFKQSQFYKNCCRIMPDSQRLNELFELYKVGAITTEGYMAQAVAFSFTDIQGRTHATQLKNFDEQNHTTGTSWLHSYLKHHRRQEPWLTSYEAQKDAHALSECLFGEHLLNQFPEKVVALVEAPKTVIYASYYLKHLDLLWLAAGSLSWLTASRCAALRGRKVILFSDSSEGGVTFQRWKEAAEKLSAKLGASITASQVLERFATDQQRKAGADLADILAENWQQLTGSQEKEPVGKLVGKLQETSPKQFFEPPQQEPKPKAQQWRAAQVVVPYRALKVKQPDLWWRALVGNLGANRDRWPKVAAENEHLPQSSRKLTQRQVSDSDLCEWWLSGSIPDILPHVGMYRLERLQPQVFSFLLQATSRTSTNGQREAALYHLRQLAQFIL